MKRDLRTILLDSPTLVGLIIGSFTIFAVTALWFSSVLESQELKAYDSLTTLKPTLSSNNKIALITINERDIQALGKWPIDDGTLATILEELESKQHPLVIGLDILRDVAIPPGHDQLEGTLLRYPNIVATYTWKEPGKSGVKPPKILQDTARIGFNDIVIDTDGVTRRALLYLGDGKRASSSFAWVLGLNYLKHQGIAPHAEPENPDQILLGKQILTPIQPDFGGYRNVDAAGYQLLADYRDAPTAFESYSIFEVLAGKIPPNALTNKIVLIGTVAESVKDYFFVPVEPTNKPYGKTPGVQLHAHFVSQLIRMAMDGDSPIKSWHEGVECAWLILWIILGTMAGFYATTLIRFPVMWLAGAAIIHGLGFLALNHSWWIPVVLPTVGWTMAFALMTSYVAFREEKNKNIAMRIFEQTVSPEIAHDIWERRHELLQELHPEPKKTEATVLFSDLIGFTGLTEKQKPEQVIYWLEDYLIAMAECVHDYDGVITRFIGDSIMVVFGAPYASDKRSNVATAATNAAKCALAMEQAMILLNKKWNSEQRPVTGIRIGINTGEVIAGSIGSPKRREYTIHGDAVNIAARLEQLRKEEFQPDYYVKPSRIFVGEATARHIDGIFSLHTEGSIQLRGKSREITVYRLIGEKMPPGG